MVKFFGEAIYVLSSKIPEAVQKDFQNIIKELNEEILLRGAKGKEEGAQITDYTIEDNKLIIRITSGKRVRVHHAVLRIKNYIQPILGRKFKIGLRSIELREPKIIIEGSHRITSKLPFVKTIKEENGKTIVILNDLSESEIKKPIIDRLIHLIEYKEEKEKWGGKVEHWREIKRSPKKEPKYSGDPSDVLIKIGWIKHFYVGQWLYTPPITHLIRKFQEAFIDIVLRPLGFIEAIYPKMVPLEVGLKTGHIKGTPHQMIFASQPISYNPEDFEEWNDLVTVLNSVPKDRLKDFVKSPEYFNCFAQCEPFYWFFGDEIIKISELPIKWFDRSGPSFRWESGGIRGLERLVEFHRIEVTWLGEPDQVVEIRNRLLEKYEYFMDKVLDLEWRWAWVTPFYLVHAGEIEKEESTIDINKPGTIDFEAWLPYRGARGDNKNWLEIGNISIHGSKYTGPFRIKHQKKNQILWTGCSGFGVQRWLVAFLSQKGFDPDNWPKEIRERITRPPKSFRAITYPNPENQDLLEKIEKLMSKLEEM